MNHPWPFNKDRGNEIMKELISQFEGKSQSKLPPLIFKDRLVEAIGWYGHASR